MSKFIVPKMTAGLVFFTGLMMAVPAAVHAEETPAGVPALTQDEPSLGTGKGGDKAGKHAEKKAEMEARLKQLPPEQQAEIRKEMKELHQKMKGMSDVERKAARKEFREKHPELFPPKHHGARKQLKNELKQSGTPPVLP